MFQKGIFDSENKWRIVTYSITFQLPELMQEDQFWRVPLSRTWDWSNLDASGDCTWDGESWRSGELIRPISLRTIRSSCRASWLGTAREQIIFRILRVSEIRTEITFLRALQHWNGSRFKTTGPFSRMINQVRVPIFECHVKTGPKIVNNTCFRKEALGQHVWNLGCLKTSVKVLGQFIARLFITTTFLAYLFSGNSNAQWWTGFSCGTIQQWTA